MSSRLHTADPSLPPPPPEPEPPSIAIRLGKWWVPFIIGAIASYILYQLRAVLTPFFLAFLLAYALDPLVNLLTRIRVPRPVGAILVFGALSVVLVFGSLYASSYFRDEFAEASKQIPAQLDALQKKIEPWLWREFRFRFPHNIKEIFARYGDRVRDVTPSMLTYVSQVLFGTLSVAVVVLGLLIIPIFAFYLLIDFDRIVVQGGKLIPKRWQHSVFETLREIHIMLAGYIRGQLLACIVLSFAYSLSLKWLGLRLAISIGMMAGLLAFIPYIGFAIALFAAFVMAMLDWHGWGFVAKIVISMTSIHLLDAFFITPKVVGKSVGLNPIELLLAMATAGSVFGVWGVLLAVPLGASTKIIVLRCIRAYKRSEFYRRAA